MNKLLTNRKYGSSTYYENSVILLCVLRLFYELPNNNLNLSKLIENVPCFKLLTGTLA